MNAFDEIIGYQNVKEELFQIIDMFKNESIYKKIGAKIPKGVLIYGEPGMGKTMLAEALIKECEVPFYILKKHSNGVASVNEINKIFNEASKNDKAIILIDDMDKYSESSSRDVDDNAFIAIQTGIDNVKYKNILVVATVNKYEKLPSSLVRNGRFDNKIRLKSPTKEDAKKIMQYYMSKQNVDKNLNYDDVSRMITYTSCADLNTILNNSAIYAAYKRSEFITIDDIVKAYLRDMLHAPEEEKKPSTNALEATCIHEAGHALVAELIKDNSVGFISAQLSRGNNVEGITQIYDEPNRRCECVMIALAGKCATELFYEGKCASGCQSDLSKAQGLIEDGIVRSGTNGIGMINCLSEQSDAYKEKLESAIQNEIEKYMFIVKDILQKNKEFLFKLKDELMNNKYLLYSDIQRIKKSVEINKIGIVF